MIDLDTIKQIREETGAGVMDVRKALQEAGSDIQKAKEIIKSKGIEKAAKKAQREIKAGRVFAYVHGGKVGALVKLGCETDFVAKNSEFETLGNEIAMQVSAMNPANVKALLKQEYIRDSSKTVESLIKEAIAKIGENITIAEIFRAEI